MLTKEVKAWATRTTKINSSLRCQTWLTFLSLSKSEKWQLLRKKTRMKVGVVQAICLIEINLFKFLHTFMNTLLN